MDTPSENSPESSGDSPEVSSEDPSEVSQPETSSSDIADEAEMTESEAVDTGEAKDSDEAVIEPIEPAIIAAARKGRIVDKIAAIVAATALGLSILLSGWFFAGFVANDYHIFGITSALGLSLFLGSFAIVPMAIIMMLARRAYQKGGHIALYLWSILLILPWMALSIICLIFTPLPIWMSTTVVLFALTLSIWGIISLILELKNRRG